MKPTDDPHLFLSYFLSFSLHFYFSAHWCQPVTESSAPSLSSLYLPSLSLPTSASCLIHWSSHSIPPTLSLWFTFHPFAGLTHHQRSFTSALLIWAVLFSPFSCLQYLISQSRMLHRVNTFILSSSIFISPLEILLCGIPNTQWVNFLGLEPVTVSATRRTNSQLPPKESFDSGSYLGSNTRVLITLTRQGHFTPTQTWAAQIHFHSVFRSRNQLPVLFKHFLRGVGKSRVWALKMQTKKQ